MKTDVQDYYDRLSPFYAMIYGDWEQTLDTQGQQLQSLLEEFAGSGPLEILDAACGIGTQTLALALRGHRVTGSDISEAPLSRAREDARNRGLSVELVLGDMRDVHSRVKKEFDVVLSMDNSIAHLLSDNEMLSAFKQFFAATKDDGTLILSVRDYDLEERKGTKVKPYGVRFLEGKTFLIFQVWQFHGALYDLSMYCTVDDGNSPQVITHVMRSRLYAIGIPEIVKLLESAGFVEVKRLDNRFFQPVLVAKKRRS